jgi:hypothetical protein
LFKSNPRNHPAHAPAARKTHHNLTCSNALAVICQRAFLFVLPADVTLT